MPEPQGRMSADELRDALKDVAALADILSTHCKTVAELIDLCRSAEMSDAVLSLIKKELDSRRR